MPGVLPMKIIKLGTSSQSRIAQACDRCRSKKIRCDGIRPCCSQCANVGFECKTSDKLSRRAFPRGYTESLEERVRSLEGEIRELKDLLDEKDEKIDMLSKMHTNRRPTATLPPPAESRKDTRKEVSREDIFKVQASPLLLNSETSDSYFMSASSGRAFIDTFKRKIQESGRSCAGFSMEPFLNPQPSTTPSKPTLSLSEDTSAPPRMFSDRCVNIFFQEWAPLFPVVHKPTFLRLYERFVVDPSATTDNHDIAQLYLVFGIAGLSCQTPDEQQIGFCEQKWQAALQSLLMDNTIGTLQCLVLAQLYCISTADYKRLQYYKAIAIGLSHRLGLHQSQKRFSFGVLSTETRLKVFWTLYTVDCFSAAILGLPKLLKEDDIYTEFPADVDDEYVTEKGFDPTLPGESTKISSALALFRAARIMTKVLEIEYPAAASYDLSLQALNTLDEELNEWSSSLPKHLKLTFVQDKPSTDITGNRSALLSLAYFSIRSLIHRPAVGSSLGSKASPSVMALADSSKHIIQIIQLLEERGMSFSFCVNKNEVLSLCGLSLLYQAIDLKTEGKLLKDNQRLICSVIKFLEKGNSPSALEFKKIVRSMFTFEQPTRPSNPGPSRRSSDNDMAAPIGIRSMPSPASHRTQGLDAFRQGNHSESDLQERARRATMSHISSTGLTKHFGHTPQIETSRSEPAISPRESKSTPTLAHATNPQASASRPKSARKPNLDYLSLSGTPETSRPQSPRPTSLATRINSHAPMYPSASAPTMASKPTAVTPGASDWETLLGSIDSGRINIHDAMYGGPALSLNDLGHNGPFNSQESWSPESWDMTSMAGLHEYTSGQEAHSVLSFSEESMTSGEDFSDLGRTSVDLGHTLIPGVGEGFLIDGIDGGFGSL